MAELEKKQQAADAEKSKVAVKEHKQLLFGSPRQVTLGNLQGDVTLVEFFDYNCGYCKRALSDLVNLMKADPKLKIVLKEFPVLDRARSSRAGGDGRAHAGSHRQEISRIPPEALSGRGQVDRARAMAVAKDIGLDMARLEKDMTSTSVKARPGKHGAADKLGLNGTPSYVVAPRSSSARSATTR